MFKSIFSKYFTILSTLIVSSFVVLGVTLSLFSARYWQDDKRALLEENARNLAQFTSQNVQRDPYENNQYYIIKQNVTPLLGLLSSAVDAGSMIVDNSGNVIVCSDNLSESYEGRTLQESVLRQLESDDAWMVGNLGGMFHSRQYTIGIPVTKDNVNVGYVLMFCSTDSMTRYLISHLQIFTLSALGVLFFTVIVLYGLTYRLVRPLRQMAAAVKQFGSGDFSARVPVYGKDEIAELATELNQMAVSLSSTESTQRHFIANVSHELRTPMTTIGGFIDGILDGTIPEEKRTFYLKIVLDEIRRLSRLVQSMLALSRIDNGQLKLNPVTFDLTDLVGSTLLSFEPRIEKKQLNIEGLEDCPAVEVTADRDLIGQVIYNLLENAVKFTEEGGTIHLALSSAGGRVYCSVKNTGIGIPLAEMPYIFERFYKNDASRALDKTGMGLGLYLVKSIIGIHRGEIQVRSIEGEYAEFVFWLPEN